MKDTKELSTILAENLVYYRKEKGLTQSQLAETLNYSDKSISKWERGEGIPDVIILRSLADLYGITIDDFFLEKKVNLRTRIKELRYKKLFIMLLSIALTWVIGATVFFVLKMTVDWKASWLIYLYAFVISMIHCVIWSSIYKNNMWLLVSLSGLIWSIAVSTHLSLKVLTDLNEWYILYFYIVAVCFEILAVVWFLFLRYRAKKKEEIKNPD